MTTDPILTWIPITKNDLKLGQTWGENAMLKDKVLFQLYFDETKKDTFLHDLTKGQTYSINEKSLGYHIAFKLFMRHFEDNLI